MAELKGLDTWLISGRYQWEYLLVTCSHCNEQTVVKAETDYGSTWWEPEECKYCQREFDKNTKFEEHYDPREDIYE